MEEEIFDYKKNKRQFQLKLEESFKQKQIESLKKHIKLLETKKLLSMSFDSLKSKLEKERQEVANLRREKAAIESELKEEEE